MAWTFEAGTPLTVQIANRVRREILGGKYAAGEDFPTVRLLAAEAAVNPNTMQKALTILEEEGLLVTLGTAGRTVTSDVSVIEAARERAARDFACGIIKEARQLGFSEGSLVEIIRRNWND